MTIKIGCKVVKEYFDITNIEHYDTILGTPFLRKMGIVLDFRSPGMAWIGNKVIPTGKVSFNLLKDTDNNIATKDNIIQSRSTALNREEARRVDHRRAHPKVPLAPARGSILILG